MSASEAKFTFAGIGTREASSSELRAMTKICTILADGGGWCYSGNADGCDIACQMGAGKKSTAWIPWDRFNYQVYDADKYCGDVIVAGEGKKGRKYAEEAFPNLSGQKQGVQKIMVRNAYQVIGDSEHPRIKFVLCCATPDPLRVVSGGTGQAVRIALKLKIPVFNIRDKASLGEGGLTITKHILRYLSS